ncbi:MAG: metallophosphoesterase [Candidatus Atribacteria bacterium]|nr:metallophosphoesterase [Candidatus Atribacteria bacterium]
MRIVILSDTHLPERAKDLPKKVYEELEKASFILHAGDLTEWWVMERLKEFAPLKVVRGNMDSQEVKAQLPEKEVFELEGIRTGLIHGLGSPAETRRKVKEAFQGENLRLLVYGHTHQPCIEKIESVVWVNPGSPTDFVFAPFFSFAYLDVKDGEIQQIELVRLD